MRLLCPLVVAAVLAGASPASAAAQHLATDQGNWILGGSAGVNTQRSTLEGAGKRQSVRHTQAHLSPRAQYFVRPGLALGGQVNLSYTRTDQDPTSSAAYGVGPAVSYFFRADEERPWYPYLSANAGYWRSFKGGAGTLGYGSAAGVMWMLTRSVAVDVALAYGATVQDPGEQVRFRAHHGGLTVGFAAFAF